MLTDTRFKVLNYFTDFKKSVTEILSRKKIRTKLYLSIFAELPTTEGVLVYMLSPSEFNIAEICILAYMQITEKLNAAELSI